MGGGGIFFRIWEFACCEACFPRIFLKRWNIVRFRVYFDQILSLFFFKKYDFYIKNKYFRHTLANDNDNDNE